MALKQRTIAFIGGGHITSIIIENLTRSKKTAASQLVVSDPDPRKLESLQKEFSNFYLSGFQYCTEIGQSVSD